jgi:hypothetical protein
MINPDESPKPVNLEGEREENQEEVLAAAEPDKVVRGVNGSLTPKVRKLRPLAGIILIALVVLAAAYMRHGLANRHKKTVKQTETEKVGAGPATTVEKGLLSDQARSGLNTGQTHVPDSSTLRSSILTGETLAGRTAQPSAPGNSSKTASIPPLEYRQTPVSTAANGSLSFAEQMLRATIEAVMKMKAIRPTQLQRINVDTTVQTKAVRYPTDARLYHRCRAKLVKAARAAGLNIKQSYEHVGRRLLMQSSRYAHARQMKRAKACTRTLRTQLGGVVREIERQVEQPTGELQKLFTTAHRIHAQQRHDKNKIYSVHAPEVECIAKGKADKKYEFGNKVSVAVSSQGGWFVGSKSFSGNPYDGHTLAEQMKQVEKLLGKQIKEVYVDMGYRGHDYAGQAAIHVDKRRRGRTPQALWPRMKHRAAVEPSIGHLKTEHRLERNRLKGAAGNAVNAVLAAAAMNFQKLLRAIPRRCLCAIYATLNRLLSSWGFSGSLMTMQPT